MSHEYIKKFDPFFAETDSALDNGTTFTPSSKYPFLSALFLSSSRFEYTGIDSQNDTLYYNRFRYSQLNLD